MKFPIYKNILLASVFTLITSGIFFGCDKTLDSDGTELEPLVPAKADTSAGNWKPMFVQANTVMVATPEATTSDNYKKELADIKTAMGSLTVEQKDAIRYWSAGGILRWNQIMRSLVAKHNLAPPENAEGKYPVPSAADPDNMNGTGTTFPFANPPYAARAYAYVSVVQYDALVAANYFKNQFKRKAPNLVDASITPTLVNAPSGATSYSYPSEEATMAGASYDFLKRLFPSPTDTLYLYRMKEQQKWYRVWAGAATKSDVEAGEKLGTAIATKIRTGRFAKDGMANAIGNTATTDGFKSKWDSLANQAEKRDGILGGNHWKSLENAPRPPMLAMYGFVKTWNMDFPDMKSISTSIPPYALNSAEFKKDLAEVRSYTDNTTRENIAIVHYWADGTGTHTPPGHWNQIAEKYIVADKESEVRAARNYALLNTAMMDAAISCWYTKNYYYYPRPSQMDPAIKTLTGLPNFQSYTSGHSTFSAAAATVLSYLFPNGADSFNAQAKEASLSRLYGGIHYRIDCEGGIKIGTMVGQKAVERAKTDGSN